jgi:hypothetical protein
MTLTLRYAVEVVVTLTDDANANVDPIMLVQEEIESNLLSVDFVDSVSIAPVGAK